jgi:hypothetical protein
MVKMQRWNDNEDKSDFSERPALHTSCSGIDTRSLELLSEEDKC